MLQCTMSRRAGALDRFQKKYGGGYAAASSASSALPAYDGGLRGAYARLNMANRRAKAFKQARRPNRSIAKITKPYSNGKTYGKGAGVIIRGKFRPGGSKSFNAKVRAVVMDQLTADNSYILQYADQKVLSGSTNNVAVQAMWGTNQVASIGTAAGTQENLHLDAPVILSSILNNINAVKTCEFTRKSYEVECTLTNCENSNVELWEYRCMARKDIPRYIDDQAAALHVNTVDYTIQNGFADATAGINTTCNYNSVGATPFMNPRFTSLYKVLKVNKRVLAPSENWCIKYSRKKPRKYTQEQVGIGRQNALNYNMLKGQTFSVFVAQGTFASNGGANATYVIGLSNIDIGMVYKTRVHYSWISDNNIATGTANSIAGYSAGAGYAPIAPLLVHPDSAIAVGASASGTRVYDSNTTSQYAIPDNAED